MSYMIEFLKKIEVKWQPHKIQLFLYWFLALYPRPRTLLHYLKKCKTALTSQHLTLFLLFAFLYLSLFVHFDQMSEGSQALKVTLCVQKNWWSLSKRIEKPQSMDSIVIMHGDSLLMNDSLICYNVMFRPTYSYLPSVRLHAIAEDLLYEKQKTFLYENSASIC